MSDIESIRQPQLKQGYRQPPQPKEAYENTGEGEKVAVKRAEKGGPGPAAIVDLSPAARQLLKEQEKEKEPVEKKPSADKRVNL